MSDLAAGNTTKTSNRLLEREEQMYPLAEGMFAPRNQWYVAALSDDVTRDPIERYILDEPIAFYRKEDGSAVALHGRCPHRSFPLGKSGVVGDDIQCGYHGITFGPDGECTSIPSQVHVPRVCKVHSYPVVERWQWIWIWPGDPDLADENLIPDHHVLGLTDPDVRSILVCFHEVNGRYMLLNDNLMDLTHIQFLHRDTFGAGTKSDQVPGHSEGPNWVESHYEQIDIEVPPLIAPILNHDGRIDRTFGLRFMAPSLHHGTDEVYSRNADGSRGKNIGSVHIIHAVTPATRTSCHYWFAVGHNWSHLPDEFTAMFASKIAPGIEEDAYATAEIERMIQQEGGRPTEILLKADHVAVRGRRVMEKLILADELGGNLDSNEVTEAGLPASV
jgi:phenylpropionate dioxygenase-like ring-hydroxylating dioxygenase large terminal subunit